MAALEEDVTLVQFWHIPRNLNWEPNYLANVALDDIELAEKYRQLVELRAKMELDARLRYFDY